MKKNLPMDAVIDLWLKEKQSSVKTSTFAYYKRVSNKILKIEWTGCTAYRLKSTTIAQLSEKLSQKYKPKTVRDIITIANQILFFAYEQGYSKQNCQAYVRIPLKKQSPEILSASEQKILTIYLLNGINPSKMGVLLSLYTGLRLGEVCGLQWKDVNLSKGIIYINKTIQRIDKENGGTTMLIDSPKTISSERAIPVPSFLVQLLRDMKTSHNADYVSTGESTFTQPRTYQNRLKSYLKDCGLPNYHFHTLRHTFASRAIELGFDPKSLSEILGHSNIKITLDLYVHPSMESKQEQMNRFENYI